MQTSESTTTSAHEPHGLLLNLQGRPEYDIVIAQAELRFSWMVPTPQQTAYQMRIRRAEETQPFWDSGKLESSESIAVPYQGLTPILAGSYAWQVRTWGADGKVSGWSVEQGFRVGEENWGKVAYPDSEIRATVRRYPLEAHSDFPVRLTKPENGRAFLDFGRAAFGSLQLTLTAERDGEAVTVWMGEAAEGERVRRQPGGSVRVHSAMIPLKAGTHSYTVPLPEKDNRRIPEAWGAVMPFRYAEVEGLHLPLSLNDARRTWLCYPYTPTAAHFASSDSHLNAIWELCRYSIEATTFCGLYVDGDRERLPYEADAYINQLGHYAIDREYTLARYTHEYLIQRPTWPTEWFLFSVLCAVEDLRYTGDTTSGAIFYEDLCQKTLAALARPDGLISTTQPPVPPEVTEAVHHIKGVRKIEDIVDWPPGERDGYDMKTPVNTVVNAFYIYSLIGMAEIATALGRLQAAEEWYSRAEKAKVAFQTQLFNPVMGLYRDGEGSEHASLHANMFPLAFGLVPPKYIAQIAAFLIQKGMACSVYGAQFLLDALFEAGEGTAALELITAKGERGWRHMIETVGTTITLEAWDAKFKPNLDWNHAWGAAPANLLPRRVLGVRPGGVGWRSAIVQPQPGRLARVEGTVPTIRGPITVQVDQSDPSRCVMTLDLPGNCPAEVFVPTPLQPKSTSPRLRVNGKAHTDFRPRSLGKTHFLHISLPPGTYVLERDG